MLVFLGEARRSFDTSAFGSPIEPRNVQSIESSMRLLLAATHLVCRRPCPVISLILPACCFERVVVIWVVHPLALRWVTAGYRMSYNSSTNFSKAIPRLPFTSTWRLSIGC